jgi:hypothetical protein
MAVKARNTWDKIPWIVAVLLTATVIFFHLTRLAYAGGLWRDEAGAAQVALMPSVHEITQVFQHEAFPLFFPLAVRAYSAVAGTGDSAVRIFGLLVGLATLAALWITARAIGEAVPLLSIALFGFNPAVIQWADSLRGYGLGIVLILITFGLIWRVVATAPSPWLVGIAAIAAICSVQTLYYNAVILFAIGIAGASVAARNKHWNRMTLVLGIGAMAAVSVIPYMRALGSAREWNDIFILPDFTFSLFWRKLSEPLSSGGPGVNWVWLLLVIGAVGASLAAQFQRPGPDGKRRRDVGLFCLITLLLGISGYFFFLKLLRYPTQPWYYVALMGIVIVALEGALSAPVSRWWKDGGRLLIALGMALWSFLPTWNAIHIRQTNVDMIAAKLEKAADSADMIVVAPWYLGVAFERYYKGAAPWTTLPPLKGHKFHRYDLLKKQMAATNPIDPVLKAMTEVLRSGHQVWIVGGLSFPQPGQIPPLLAPAPYDPVGWSESAYTEAWSLQAGYLLRTRALSAERVPLPGNQPVNPYENAELVEVRGWRTR